MTSRILASITCAATVAGVASLPVAGQGRPAAPPLVVTAYNGGAPVDYAMPRTPWGDPDLQGVWSSDDATMPMQRLQDLGTPLYLEPEALAQRENQIEAGVERAENAVGSFRGDFARRAFGQTSPIVDPPDGRMPAFTSHAETRRAPRDRGTFGEGPFETPEDFTLYDRCVTRGIAGSVLRVIYGNGNRIVQAPGMVAISYEMIHDTRVFYTDGRPHVGDPIRQYLGDARARWEGDELVVETRNLTDRTSIGLNGNGLRHSDRMAITERFRRVAEDVLQYQITIDDPVTYEGPFTMSMPLTPLDGDVLLPYDCHEGNLAILQSLGAERAEDQALEDDLARGLVRPRRGVQESGSGGGGGGGGRGRGAAPVEGDQER
jgi:hypothetical protein